MGHDIGHQGMFSMFLLYKKCTPILSITLFSWIRVEGSKTLDPSLLHIAYVSCRSKSSSASFCVMRLHSGLGRGCSPLILYALGNITVGEKVSISPVREKIGKYLRVRADLRFFKSRSTVKDMKWRHSATCNLLATYLQSTCNLLALLASYLKSIYSLLALLSCTLTLFC